MHGVDEPGATLPQLLGAQGAALLPVLLAEPGPQRVANGLLRGRRQLRPLVSLNAANISHVANVSCASHL